MPLRPINQGFVPSDYTPVLVPNAVFPTDQDLEYKAEDYVVGPHDVLDVSIQDLFEAGREDTLRRAVSASGYIDLPLLPERIKVEGLTASQIKQAVINAYSPDILRNPTVSVAVAMGQANTFSILGAIARPQTYPIIRKDMRMLEALAVAGGITQTNIQYIYVIRPSPATRINVAPEQAAKGPATQAAASTPSLPQPALPTTTGLAPITPGSEDVDAALRELGGAVGRSGLAAPATSPQTLPAPSATHRFDVNAAATSRESRDAELDSLSQDAKWIYSPATKQWVRVTVSAAASSQPDEVTSSRPAQEQADGQGSAARRSDSNDPFGWKKADKSDTARIIAINLKKLQDGDPRMNIVIRDNDVVQVPTLDVGEFYVMGEVARPGVYTLTGRRVTVKMAIAAAGNLGPMAWPKNVVLYRRIGDNQEQAFPLNVEAIFRGEDNDTFLKADDVLAVGQSAWSPFAIVMRNAFRLTYGFGFIYDRNFADPVVNTLDRRRFTEW